MDLGAVWRWLYESSNSISSLLSIIAIVFTVYVARNSPKWRYEADYRLSIIRNVFPSLLSDINKTINNYDRFMSGAVTHYSKFDKLGEIISSGQIEYIRIIDELLYENLYIIINDIKPLLEEVEENRSNLSFVLSKRWKAYLKSRPQININYEKYIEELYSISVYFLWIENYDEVLKCAEELSEKMCAQLIDEVNEPMPISNVQIRELINIGKEEVYKVKHNMDDIKDIIKTIIEENVVKSIQKHIRDPF